MNVHQRFLICSSIRLLGVFVIDGGNALTPCLVVAAFGCILSPKAHQLIQIQPDLIPTVDLRLLEDQLQSQMQMWDLNAVCILLFAVDRHAKIADDLTGVYDLALVQISVWVSGTQMETGELYTFDYDNYITRYRTGLGAKYRITRNHRLEFYYYFDYDSKYNIDYRANKGTLKGFYQENEWRHTFGISYKFKL